MVTYVNQQISCYETPQRRKAVTKSLKKLQQELTSQDEEILLQELTSRDEEMLQQELTSQDEEMLQQDLTSPNEEMLQEELKSCDQEMLQQELTSPDEDMSMKTEDSIDFKRCLQQKKKKKRRNKITMSKSFSLAKPYHPISRTKALQIFFGFNYTIFSCSCIELFHTKSKK